MTKSSIQASLSPLFKVHLTTALIRGESRKFRNGRPGHLPAIYMHTIYLTEHSLKLIQNFKEKRGGHGQLSQTLNPSTLMFSKALQCQPEK